MTIKSVTQADLKQRIVEALQTIYDPEIPVNIWEVGLIYEVTVDEGGNAHVLMTLTSPNCPVAESLPPEVEEKVATVEGVHSARVEITWDPPWDPDMMSEAAQLELGLF
jgi:FeS assembly SUF system protein